MFQQSLKIHDPPYSHGTSGNSSSSLSPFLIKRRRDSCVGPTPFPEPSSVLRSGTNLEKTLDIADKEPPLALKSPSCFPPLQPYEFAHCFSVYIVVPLKEVELLIPDTSAKFLQECKMKLVHVLSHHSSPVLTGSIVGIIMPYFLRVDIGSQVFSNSSMFSSLIVPFN